MDVSRVSYFVPHERVFVNNKRRSNSVSTLKSTKLLEFNKNINKVNFTQNNLHAIKHDSNYLLGSSIVNVNFVNNVSNLNRGFEAYKSIPMLNSPIYQRNILEPPRTNMMYKSDTLTKFGSNINNYDMVYPFENYTYKKVDGIQTTVSKKNLNIDDKIITNRSYLTSGSSEISESRDNSLAILTKNYLNNSPVSGNRFKRETKDEPKQNVKMCTLNSLPDLKKIERKNKLTQYLDKIKNEKQKCENGQKRIKITIGKPVHEFIAKYPDPVEKELENWHNSHNSTLKWERVKHGLYTVDGSNVHLLKINGGLYVEGHGFKKYKGKMTILRFVEEKESILAKEKS